MLRIETIPDGAVVYVEGRRVKGKVTPLETFVAANLLRRKKIKVAIRKPGYAKLNAWVPMAEGWLEETDAIVYNLEPKLEMARRVRRVRRQPAPDPEPPADDTAAADDGASADDVGPVADTPPGDDSTAGDDPPSAGEPAGSGDGPKADEPPPAEEQPAADEPSPEPTPAAPAPTG
jgi:hypothetical protein